MSDPETPVTPETAIAEIRQCIASEERATTHWDGCWRKHRNCATLLVLDQLDAALARVQEGEQARQENARVVSRAVSEAVADTIKVERVAARSELTEAQRRIATLERELDATSEAQRAALRRATALDSAQMAVTVLKQLESADALLTERTRERDEAVRLIPTEQPFGERRLMLNAYGRACYDSGRQSAEARLTQAQAVVEAAKDLTTGVHDAVGLAARMRVLGQALDALDAPTQQETESSLTRDEAEARLTTAGLDEVANAVFTSAALKRMILSALFPARPETPETR